MGYIVKIILGFSFFIVLMAVAITVSVYAVRKTKNGSSSPGPPSNTTMSGTTGTGSNTIAYTTAGVTASTMVDTTISITTISSATASGTSVSTTNSTPVISINSTSTSSTSVTSIGSTASSMTVTTTNSTSANATSGTSIGIISSTAVNMALITSAKLTATSTITMVSNSSTCPLAFQPMVIYTTENFIGPIAVADGNFNRDSYMDIVVANFDDSSVSVLLGNGNGTFQPETTYSVGNGTGPIAIAVADFNNDNLLDTVVANYQAGNIVVLLGNGNGALTTQNKMSTGSYSWPSAVVVGYLNNDSILDIAVANSGTNKVGIFIGNGNGTFQSQTTISAGSNSEPMGIAIGDFNRYSYMDIVVANLGLNKVGVLLGYGTGSFRSLVQFPAGTYPTWINVADFNGDSQLDVAVLNAGDNNVGILLGNRNGTFGTQITYPVGNSSFSYFFAIADANNDGRWDIVIPNTANNNIGILLGKGDGTFGVQMIILTEEYSESSGLAVADFNHDNRPDIVVANYGTNDVGILLGTC